MNKLFFVISLFIVSNLIADPASAPTPDPVKEKSRNFILEALSAFSYGTGKVCEFCENVVKGAGEIAVNYGKGEAAREMATKQEATIKDMQNRIDIKDEQLAESNATLKQVVNQNEVMRETTVEQVATQKETNNILQRGFNELTKQDTIDKMKAVTGIAANGVVVGAGIYGGYQVVKSYYWPSDREKLDKVVATKELKKIEAESALYECFVRYSEGEKDSEGMPVKCKETLANFASVVGYHRLKAEKEAFINR